MPFPYSNVSVKIVNIFVGLDECKRHTSPTVVKTMSLMEK